MKDNDVDNVFMCLKISRKDAKTQRNFFNPRENQRFSEGYLFKYFIINLSDNQKNIKQKTNLNYGGT